MFLKSLRLFALAALVLPPAARVCAQAPLTPPGAPAPGQRSLAQIAPRTPIESLPGDAAASYVISAPGSYYLSAGNVIGVAGRAAIAVNANDVSIDLNGFTLLGAPTGTRGIEVRAAVANLRIGNGAIRNWTLAGVGLTAPTAPVSVAIDGLAISGISAGPGIGLWIVGDPANSALTVQRCTISGAQGGILLGSSGVVQGCSVNGIQGGASATYGILAGSVTGCEVSNVAGSGGSDAYGINANTVQGCAVSQIDSTGSGISLGIQAQSVANCAVSTVGRTSVGVGEGISAASVSNCSVNTVGNTNSASIQYGIESSGTVSDCAVFAVGNSGHSVVIGIQAEVVQRCRVSSLVSMSSVIGIAARLVDGCHVANLNSNGSSGSLTAIQADAVTNTRVTSLNAVSSSPLVGFTGSKQVTGCSATGLNNSGTGGVVGIDLATGGAAEQCQLSLNSGTAIRATAVASVRQCAIGGSNGVTGIDLQASGSLCDGNQITGCTFGVKAVGNSLVVRNHVTTTVTKFNVAANVKIGPIVTAVGSIASTSPWANFTD